jgi:ornithine cyclodeaminase
MLTVLSQQDVMSCIPSPQAILKAVENAYVAKMSGDGQLGLRGYMNVPENKGTFVTMQGVVNSVGLACVKVIGSFPDNVEKGIKSENGLYTFYDANTGLPHAILDAGDITVMRTGAVSAIGAKYLARPDARILSVVGTGKTAWWSIKFIADLFALDEIRVYGRNRIKLKSFVNDISSETNVRTTAATGWQDCLQGSDIMVDATMLKEHEAHFRTEWIKPGALVIAFGIKSSFELDLTKYMDKTIVDDWSAVPPKAPNGALWPQIESGHLNKEALHGEIGEIIGSEIPGRTSNDEKIIFWHRGMVLCDILIAAEIIATAKSKGYGAIIL